MKPVINAAVLAGVAVILLGSGCASITGSTAQTISMQTRDKAGKDVVGASCEMTNDKGRWLLQTPGTATIVRSNEDMQVLCNKAGHDAGRGSIVSATKGAIWGNILVGGAVGALVDHTSGAAYEYPSHINIVMGGTVRIEPDPYDSSQSEVNATFSAPSTIPAAALASSTGNVEERLRELKRLHDSGLITREIYIEQQRKVIEGAPTERAREVPTPTPHPPAAPAEQVAGPHRPERLRVGDHWKYSIRDHKYNQKERHFTVRVTGINGSSVDEVVHFDGVTSIASTTDIKSLRFAARAVNDSLVVELSPYLVPKGGDSPYAYGPPADYPIGISGERFRMRVESIQPEDVILPLGAFKTVRVIVSGQRSGTDFGAAAGIRWNPYFVARFRYTAWYAPELGRYVKSRHMQWNPGGELTGDEIVQLLDYSKN